MASEQMMSEAIGRAVMEATRVALQTMVEAQVERTQNAAGPKLGSPAMKQPKFDWEAPDMYSEFKTFRLEVNNVLSTHNMPEAEKLLVEKERPPLFRNPNNGRERNVQHVEGLFELLANKFKPQYNETIKSLQFRKLYQFENKNVEEWMGRLHMAVVECNYQEIDRQLKEQFIHGLND